VPTPTTTLPSAEIALAREDVAPPGRSPRPINWPANTDSSAASGNTPAKTHAITIGKTATRCLTRKLCFTKNSMEAVEMAVNQKNRRRNNGSKAGIVNLLIHYVYSLLIIAAARCKTEHTSDRFFLQPALSINGKRFLFCSHHRAAT
jgi:hypothetical protein